MGKLLWKDWQWSPSTYQNRQNLGFIIYAGIGTIRLIRQKAILADGFEFHIWYEGPSVTGF